MQKQATIFPLRGIIQPYSWGGNRYIAALLGQTAPASPAQAEYWLGAHANHPSTVLVDHHETSLYDLIRKDPDSWLGKAVKEQFGELPFLFKVLDVKDMLSIQVHPDKASARKGFMDENERGIPVHAPHRNYKDQNHKPELMYALSEFWLLHGFKPAGLLEKSLQDVPELQFLLPVWKAGSYEAIYRLVMEMPQEEVQTILEPLIRRILPEYEKGLLTKEDPGFWAARAYGTFCTGGTIDRGIFSIYLFNIVNLHPGEAIFQDAGVLHAYLEGQNLELMANSDNVLRGGLTNKHIDVPELMKYVRFSETIPEPITGKESPTSGEYVFPTPAADFEFRAILLAAGEAIRLNTHTCDIFLVLEGTVEAKAGENSLTIHKGQSFVAQAGAELTLKASTGLRLFRATVPFPQA